MCDEYCLKVVKSTEFIELLNPFHRVKKILPPFRLSSVLKGQKIDVEKFWKELSNTQKISSYFECQVEAHYLHLRCFHPGNIERNRFEGEMPKDLDDERIMRCKDLALGFEFNIYVDGVAIDCMYCLFLTLCCLQVVFNPMR
jgi:hypothetical protein